MRDFSHVTIETPRLILREVTMQDVKDFDDVRKSVENNPDITPHIFLTGEGSAEKFCKDCVKHQRENPRNELFLAIAEKNNPLKAIGFMVSFLEEMNWEGEKAYMDIGYCLHTGYQGRGYATEASKAMIDFFFKEFNLEYVSATSHPDNVISHKVLYRLGFRQYGDVIKKYDSLRLLFKLTREDFYSLEEK